MITFVWWILIAMATAVVGAIVGELAALLGWWEYLGYLAGSVALVLAVWLDQWWQRFRRGRGG